MRNADVERIANFRDWFLKDLTCHSESRSVVLSFEHWEGKKCWVILAGVVQLNISGTPGDDGDALVFSSRVELVDDGGKQVLEELAHNFRGNKGGTAFYPGTRLLHLDLEGDLCVEAVCQEVEIRDEEAPRR